MVQKTHSSPTSTGLLRAQYASSRVASSAAVISLCCCRCNGKLHLQATVSLSSHVERHSPSSTRMRPLLPHHAALLRRSRRVSHCIPRTIIMSNKNMFQVTVEGQLHNVESGTHICELKKMINEGMGIGQRFNLVFGGKVLKCCSAGTPAGEGHSNPPVPCNKTCPTLQHYSIQSASVLRLSVPV